MEVVERLNTLLASCDECCLQSFEKGHLIVIGSYDIGYHHHFEAEFVGVSYVQCPTGFFADAFRLATYQERTQFNLADYTEEQDFFFCFESNGHSFFIVARSLELREGLVLHYKRND